jgi:hypothetical protein
MRQTAQKFRKPKVRGIITVGTNCNNCHNRAGWPTGKNAGQASYQNPDCSNPLQTLSPSSADAIGLPVDHS